MREKEGLNTPKIALTGAVFVLFVATLVVALTALFMKVSQDEEERKALAPPREYTNLVIQQQSDLNDYAWVDRNKGIVRIPIDRAMELTVRELSGQEENGRGKGE